MYDSSREDVRWSAFPSLSAAFPFPALERADAVLEFAVSSGDDQVP